MILLALLMCLFFVGGFALDSYLNQRWGITPMRFDRQASPSSTFNAR